MKLILENGVARYEHPPEGCRPKREVIYEAFLLWAHKLGMLERLQKHFGPNPFGYANRILLTNYDIQKHPQRWARAIAEGRVTITERIECELN